MVSAKAWKLGQAGEPPFPSSFEIVQKAVLQVTDIKSNHNKYYAIELHKADPKGDPDAAGAKTGGKAKASSIPACRVFTHYGRTDDLDTNPDSGQKECRYFGDLAEAQAVYQTIYRQKTGPGKGYKEVCLASSRIGSLKARGTSAGEVDAKTLEKLAQAKAEAAAKEGKPPPPPPKRLDLHPGVQDLVRYIYAEATNALTSTVSARITANGIETPLGILTIGQIEKGEAILAEAYKVFQDKSARGRQQKLEDLSGQFYTVIPHRIGRSRLAVLGAVLDNLEAFASKQETLQLMKDMLRVNGEDGAGSVLYDAQVDMQYKSLKCEVGFVEPGTDLYRQIEGHAKAGQRKWWGGCGIKVRNVYKVRRPGEWEDFEAASAAVGDHRLLFHGSGIQNWVGLLSRGILLPKLAVSLGARRTDAGWLGHGIYFGDVSSTSAAYTSPGRNGRNTRFMAVARVALGKVKDYTKITYGLTAPPEGYHSCHGVRAAGGVRSDFYDDEYVIYNPKQQRMEYLVEFTM